MKVVTYQRCSTLSQNYQSQISELSEYCKIKGWEIVEVFSEKISGYKKNEERGELMRMISFLKENKDIKKVVISECSRFSRNVVEFEKGVNKLKNIGVSLHIKQFGIDTLRENGEEDIFGGFFMNVLTCFSSLERDILTSRLKRGYDEYRKNNKVGRKKGYKKSSKVILEENKDIVRKLKQNYTIREIASITKKGNGLVQKVKRIMREENLL